MLQAIVDLSVFTPIWSSYFAKMPIAARRIAEETARETEAEMKRRAPVGKTGRLQINIRALICNMHAHMFISNSKVSTPELVF